MKTFVSCIILLVNFLNVVYSQIYIEQISGVTSTLTSVSVNKNTFAYYGVAWICGFDGIVLRTTNDGSNWINVSGNGIPSNTDLVNIFAFDTLKALTAGYTGSGTFVYRTSNGGLNWQQVFSQPNGFINGVWMKSPLLGFMCGDPVGNRWSLWKTSNGGMNWDSSGMYLPAAGTEAGWNNSLFVKSNMIWFGTNNHKIFFSSNFGSSWLSSAMAETNIYSLWFTYTDSIYGYYGGANSYKTTNGGSSWTLMNCPGTGNFAGFSSGLALNPNNPWPPSMSWAVRSDNKIYMNFNMTDWYTIYTAPAGNYTYIGSNYNYLYQFTWAVRSNGGITRIVTVYGSVKKISSEIPDGFSLSQNYPNPFNPVTKIKFQIPLSRVVSAGWGVLVRLGIYDVLGRAIATLVNEQLQPGTYEVEWDASNYPSGVYFYQLSINNEQLATRKMVLVK